MLFNFGDEQIFIDGTSSKNEVSAGKQAADCSIEVSLEDFIALSSGKMNPMGAMMSGKIKIDGDMGVAMKLQSLFQ